jgi:NCK-associated protein 1
MSGGASTSLYARLWQTALEGCLCICLYRDEVLLVHQYLQGFFDHMKGYSKRVSELKDFYTTAVHHS